MEAYLFTGGGSLLFPTSPTYSHSGFLVHIRKRKPLLCLCWLHGALQTVWWLRLSQACFQLLQREIGLIPITIGLSHPIQDMRVEDREHSIRNIISTIVITTYGAWWELEVSGVVTLSSMWLSNHQAVHPKLIQNNVAGKL